MNREVTADECLRVSGDPTEFQRMIGQIEPGDDGHGNKQAPARGPMSGTAKR